MPSFQAVGIAGADISFESAFVARLEGSVAGHCELSSLLALAGCAILPSAGFI